MYSEFKSKQLIIMFLLSLSLCVSAQNKLNFGLTQPQDPSSLPVSKVAPQTSVRKLKTIIVPVLEKVAENEFLLNTGWEMAEADQVIIASQSIFNPDFNTSDWYNATVPGTVLTTLVDQGVYPDPYFGLNNLSIPESLCRKDWWYRLQLALPQNSAGKTVWLLFNGINYKADIWLNGKLLGRIAGAFQRGEFNATNLLSLQGKNILAVHIYPPYNPGIPHEESLKTGAGPNGGQLCLDGPTFISSEGWDWVPGIRDRNIGIWQDVRLLLTNAVTIVDPQVITDLPLPDTTSAEITIKSGVKNNSNLTQKVTLNVQIGNIEISKTIDLMSNELRSITFSSQEFPQLNFKNPRLWWPNGYGRPEMYQLNIQADLNGALVSDNKKIRFGIREYSYEISIAQPENKMWRVEFNPLKAAGKVLFNTIDRLELGNGTALPQISDSADPSLFTSINKNSDNPFLVIKVNGVPVFCKGGNWGMDDAMKRVSRERLEPYFRLHREANFNMVRNWTGESTEEVFYDLCDEYGMLVWNDFWLSTEGYNLNVNDDQLFMANATDVIKRFRNHPSIAIWCPRNEGYAPVQLETQLQALIATEDGTRMYQPNSRYLNLRPSGPWRFYPDPANYIKDAGGFNTEIGIPSVPTAESMNKMMAKEDVWPVSDVWAYHDFHDGRKDYCNTIETLYGKPETLEDFCKKAQMINYESHRAMFEAWNSKLWDNASGVLLWMTHPAWPSTDWQVYSWDYETLGSYFGAKKACEPIHIQMNLNDNKVVVVNTSLKTYNQLNAFLELYDLNGQKLNSKSINTKVLPNQLTYCFTAELPSGQNDVYLIRLTLSEGKNILSRNEYWRSNIEINSFDDFNHIPETFLKAKVLKKYESMLSFEIMNPSRAPAIGLKFNLRDQESGKTLLPAYFSDGYFTMFPGEKRQIDVACTSPKLENSEIIVEGYNLKPELLFVIK
jgi:hypothetical protein